MPEDVLESYAFEHPPSPHRASCPANTATRHTALATVMREGMSHRLYRQQGRPKQHGVEFGSWTPRGDAAVIFGSVPAVVVGEEGLGDGLARAPPSKSLPTVADCKKSKPEGGLHIQRPSAELLLARDKRQRTVHVKARQSETHRRNHSCARASHKCRSVCECGGNPISVSNWSENHTNSTLEPVAEL